MASKRRIEEGETIYGLRAGLAVFTRRPEDIQRIAFAREVRPQIADLLKFSANRHIPTFEVHEDELARIAQSRQHEGLAMLARARKWTSPNELGESLVRSKGVAVALDRVRNPYNVGAVMRSLAFFGVDAVLLGTPAPHPGLPPDAIRVAEGGAEHLLVSRTTDLADTLQRLRARGVKIIAADQHARDSAIGFRFPRPVLLIVGNEREGIHDRVRAQCDHFVKIPGSGAIESLNVAVATSILVAQITHSPP